MKGYFYAKCVDCNCGLQVASSKRCRKCKNAFLKANPEKSPRWNGGKRRTVKGYVEIRVNQKYMHEHRFVFEKHIGRPLSPLEVIRHINGIRDDNRLENLVITDHIGLRKIHRIVQSETCIVCKKIPTKKQYLRRGMCSKHYQLWRLSNSKLEQKHRHHNSEVSV